MQVLCVILGLFIIVVTLLDTLETTILPRRVARHFRPTAWFYRRTWIPWRRFAQRFKTPARREAFLGYFGPFSLILLLVFWAVGLIFGFALLQYGAGKHVHMGNDPITFGTLMYHSGETFFTLGYGDITPDSPFSRALAVLEAGMGFAFLGVVVGYIPTIYSAFSRREIEISLLDARAGSPPTAAELLIRFARSPHQEALDRIFRDWERWAAEVLESHISYPVLSFFRSQHNNQSWLGGLTAILDATSLVIAGVGDLRMEQAKITFAAARHAVVDLAQVVVARYNPDAPDRLPSRDLLRLQQALAEKGLQLGSSDEAAAKLKHLRFLYEPYAEAIGRNLAIDLPPWIHSDAHRDNWQAGPWDRLVQARSLGERTLAMDDHF
jgi:hypothetical protein